MQSSKSVVVGAVLSLSALAFISTRKEQSGEVDAVLSLASELPKDPKDPLDLELNQTFFPKPKASIQVAVPMEQHEENDANSGKSVKTENQPGRRKPTPITFEEKTAILLKSAHEKFINCQSKEPAEVFEIAYNLVHVATVICAHDQGLGLSFEECQALRSNLSQDSVAIGVGVTWFIVDKDSWPDCYRMVYLQRAQREAKRKGAEWTFNLTDEDSRQILELYSRAINICNQQR